MDKQKSTPSSSPSGSKPKVRKPSIPLPDWLPENLWFEYEDMRKRKRASMTDSIRFRIIKRLTEFKEGGLDPLASLEVSIRNSWTDVFEPKNGGSNGQGNNHGGSEANGSIPRIKTGSAYFDGLLEPLKPV